MRKILDCFKVKLIVISKFITKVISKVYQLSIFYFKSFSRFEIYRSFKVVAFVAFIRITTKPFTITTMVRLCLTLNFEDFISTFIASESITRSYSIAFAIEVVFWKQCRLLDHLSLPPLEKVPLQICFLRSILADL